ncbi:MAG: bifunctional aldolase/short-chain dehydrogenase [Chloroflexota bacterium]|nr:bifunctional aldolase/short-chain dehydrogenase [Chloroflexota bacterium]
MTVHVSAAGAVEDRWDAGKAAGLGAIEGLVYRSNLLGADRSVANYGGGNTSTKLLMPDHTGRETRTIWVKGSGSDLATITATGFTGLRLDDMLLLQQREQMSDEEMVAYLASCQLRPAMPRSSIETLLHAFVPHTHVDHTHPDATNMLCCTANGEALARECYGDEMVWVPYIRPGFTLSKQVGEAASAPGVRLVLLAKHGLVTWGETHEECYHNTIYAINKAAEFVTSHTAGREPFGGRRALYSLPASRRDHLLASVLPTLRGAVSTSVPKILQVDTSDAVREFVCGAESETLTQVGAACPDHLVHTKRLPLWVPFDPEREAETELKEQLVAGVESYRKEYEAYFERNPQQDSESMADPNPRVVLIEGVGMVTAGANLKAARLSGELYHRAIAVMRGASALGEYVSLTEGESYAVEYWPLELYKLTLAPKPSELEGRVAFVTGGAGGIGSAIARTLQAAGACVVVADLDAEGAAQVAAELEAGWGHAVIVDVTEEDAVVAAYREATLTYGGVDILVSNAGLAASASVEETSVQLWDRNHSVLTRGYFLVSREAFKVLKQQGIGGSIVFIASKNALMGGKNASAYSSAKAAELHLARCLAEEGGGTGIRVNTVNPDAVLQGSRIWTSSWREERARSYGIAPDELEEHYRRRTLLGVNILPEDIAEAVLFFTSSRSSKSTGNFINVDGGVSAAFPR